MASIFEHLNKLNVNMQGKNICIRETMSEINAMKKITFVAEPSCIEKIYRHSPSA